MDEKKRTMTMEEIAAFMNPLMKFSSMMRDRTWDYQKEGMSLEEAQAKAFQVCKRWLEEYKKQQAAQQSNQQNQ